jgi:hypothetical protein
MVTLNAPTCGRAQTNRLPFLSGYCARYFDKRRAAAVRPVAHWLNEEATINLQRPNDLADQALDPFAIERELTRNLQTKVIKVEGSERVLAPSSCI